MSHGLDFSTGKPAMAYVGTEPWHGLGEKLNPDATLDQWTVAAGLDWKLERLPVMYLADSALRTMDDRFVLARSDTKEALSVVSADYNPVQPKQVIEFYKNLVDHYGYKLETAGALNGGRKVWALARTGRVHNIGGDEELGAYLLLATSCDKSLATMAAFTSIRVVCQNTLGFAYQDVRNGRQRHIKVPHNRTFDPQAMQESLGLLDQSWEAFIGSIEKMARQPLSDADSYFTEVLRPSPGKPLTRSAERELLTLRTLYRSAPGQTTESADGTLWGAVNAVTYYVDHSRKGNSGDRMDSAWFGNGDAMKDRAWQLAENLLKTLPRPKAAQPILRW